MYYGRVKICLLSRNVAGEKEEQLDREEKKTTSSWSHETYRTTRLSANWFCEKHPRVLFVTFLA